MSVFEKIREGFLDRKKTFLCLFIGLLSFFFLKEASYFLYQTSPGSQVIDSGAYYASKSDLSEGHDSDSFLFPYHLKILRSDLSPQEFKNYCKFLLYIATAILISYSSFTRGYFFGIFIGFFLLFSPLYLIQNTWLGFADHLTFLWSVLLLLFLDQYYKNKDRKIYSYAILLILILGSWTHFYQFLIISFLIMFLFFREKKEMDLNILKVFVSGVLAGRISAFLIFYAQGIEWNERRLYTAGAHGFRHWYSNHTKHLLLSLLSFFNGLLPLFFENLLQRRISFYLVFLGAILITFFTADATRVFANLFYPLWIGFWLLRANKGFSKNEKWILTSGLVLAFLYLLLLDPFYQWGGDIFFLKKGKL